MKFSVFLALLLLLDGPAVKCEASKPWNVDAYTDEPFCVFRWIGYLKKLFLITLTLSAVILYYIPESRCYARKGCYMLVDLLAESLKAILCGAEDIDPQRSYAKIKSEYRCWRYGETPNVYQEQTYENNDWTVDDSRKYRSSKTLVDQDEEEFLRRQERRKRHIRRNKEEKRKTEDSCIKSYDSSIGDVPVKSYVEISSTTGVGQNEIDDVQNLVRSKLYSVARRKSGQRSFDNYASFLISGTPREMAMIEQKYEKDDIIILQEPGRTKRRRRGHGIPAAKTQEKIENPETEGPTRDRDSYPLNYSKNSDTMAKVFLTNQQNEMKLVKEFIDFKEPETDLVISNGGSNHRCPQDDDPNFRSLSTNSTFLQDVKNESTYNSVESNGSCKLHWRRKVLEKRRDETRKNNTEALDKSKVYFTGGDRQEEAEDDDDDDDDDLHLDERPQRESNPFRAIYRHIGHQEACRAVPAAEHSLDFDGLQPALKRAVNWLFGSCPNAAVPSGEFTDEVGKEEIRDIGTRSATGGSACRENRLRLRATTANRIGRD